VNDYPYMIYVEDGEDEIFTEMPCHVLAPSMMDAVLEFYTDEPSARQNRVIAVGKAINGDENIADIWRCIPGESDHRTYANRTYPVAVESLFEWEREEHAL
jgi:hypothetical protein